MKQTASFISTYSADVFGVCSALFELGGMVVMHDASGCNSTYTTHDEPRWFDMDSMVYISALSEMEAIMGDDEKLIGDIEQAASAMHPKFIAIAGTPIPAMTGFDYDAVAELIEQRTGIPTFGFATTGMNTYVHGASMALEAIAKRFVKTDVQKTRHPSANILGLTPLDFSVNGTDRSMKAYLESAGFEVISTWAMGSTLEEMSEAGRASVNLVVSATGMGAAKALNKRFGTPYVVAQPIGDVQKELLRKAMLIAIKTGKNKVGYCDQQDVEIAVIGEGVFSLALASGIEWETGRGTKVLCATECPPGILRAKDRMTQDEDDILPELMGVRVVIADPLYRRICPEGVRFIPLPSEAFSGRIYRKEIPDLVSDFKKSILEVL